MVYGSRFTVYAIELRGGFFITVNRQLTTINTEIGAIWLNSDETMIKAEEGHRTQVILVMGINQEELMGLPQEKELRYTYYDYVSWPDDERWELIDGEAFAMTPAPKTRHQSIIVQLARNVAGGVQSSGCRLFVAPTDVVFDVDNVVQPDVFVVCDPGRITADNIQGAPDLIIEVLSASTEFRDKREKKRLYEKFGVMEYLLVYPEREYVERYFLENGRYGAPELINWDESLLLRVVAVKVNLWEIFEREKRQG